MESMLIYIWHLLITMRESKEGRKTSKIEKAREKKLKHANLAFLNAYKLQPRGVSFSWLVQKKISMLIFAC
jgi:hypothetical protein